MEVVRCHNMFDMIVAL